MYLDRVNLQIKVYGFEGLTDTDEQGHTFIKRSGVVLIDEVDAHLHPEWQREIGFWFKRHFPKIQFLVTTHSPITCQAADPKAACAGSNASRFRPACDSRLLANRSIPIGGA